MKAMDEKHNPFAEEGRGGVLGITILSVGFIIAVVIICMVWG